MNNGIETVDTPVYRVDGQLFTSLADAEAAVDQSKRQEVFDTNRDLWRSVLQTSVWSARDCEFIDHNILPHFSGTDAEAWAQCIAAKYGSPEDLVEHIKKCEQERQMSDSDLDHLITSCTHS